MDTTVVHGSMLSETKGDNMDRNDLRIITRLMFRLLPMQILLGLVNSVTDSRRTEKNTRQTSAFHIKTEMSSSA